MFNFLSSGGVPAQPKPSSDSAKKAPVRALPAAWYTTREMYEFERRAIAEGPRLADEELLGPDGLEGAAGHLGRGERVDRVRDAGVEAGVALVAHQHDGRVLRLRAQRRRRGLPGRRRRRQEVAGEGDLHVRRALRRLCARS